MWEFFKGYLFLNKIFFLACVSMYLTEGAISSSLNLPSILSLIAGKVAKEG